MTTDDSTFPWKLGRTPYRRHSEEFKQRVCAEIRSGALGRRDAQKKYRLSDNLLQQWLAKYPAGAPAAPPLAPPNARVLADYARRIEALEHQIGQLMDELERRAAAEPGARDR